MARFSPGQTVWHANTLKSGVVRKVLAKEGECFYEVADSDGMCCEHTAANTPTATAPHTFKETSIGALSDDNPNIRRDGVTVTSVTPGGPADQAGIKPGDVIIAIENHYLFTVAELREEIRHCQPGARINLRYRRYATIYDVSVAVGRDQ
jgi:C-terminal processing protease CtpA/Prc